MTNSDKPNNLFAHAISLITFFAHAQLQNSVKKTLNKKKQLTQTSNKTNWWSFDESLARSL